MQVSVINSHRVSFGDRLGMGPSLTPRRGSFSETIKDSLKKVTMLKEAVPDKFTYEQVIEIAHLKTLPERLAKIADILLKKMN